MRIGSSSGLALVFGVAVWGLAGGAGSLGAQTSAAPAQTTRATEAVPSAGSAPAPAKKDAKDAKGASNSSSNRRLGRVPIEQAPPTAGGPDETAAQRAADQKLLQQQQAQSAQGARITDQQVKTAQQRIDRVQNEPRIQDAPGPSQTGVVPAAGPPVQPGGAAGGATIQDAPTVQDSANIQDAPGPSQTLAPGPSVPAQPLAPPHG